MHGKAKRFHWAALPWRQLMVQSVDRIFLDQQPIHSLFIQQNKHDLGGVKKWRNGKLEYTKQLELGK